MAWNLEGTTSAIITAGTGSQNVTLPGGTPSEGDLVIVAVAGDINCTGSITTADYTLADNGTGANPGAHVGYKVMTSSPDTVVAIARDATILKSVVVQVWSGGNAASILDQSMPTAATGTSANPNCPSIVTQYANALVFAIAHLDDDDSTVSVYPTGYSNGQSGNTGQSETSVGSTVALCSKIVASPGTEDPSAYTMSSSDAWRANTISFRIYVSGTAFERNPANVEGITDSVVRVVGHARYISS